MKSVRIDAPAKINLRLVILDRTESGYHSLETLLCGISLHDTVEIQASRPGIQLDVAGSVDTGPPEDNLVVKAAELFFERLSEAPAIRVRLEKVIPSRAGLGGGSSDAAATLRALNARHGYPFDDATLRDWGASLGSDIPFFLTRSPYALAWSRGERLLEIEPPPPRHVLIVDPGVMIPTAVAFRRFAELRSGRPAARTAAALTAETLSSWPPIHAAAWNDFEEVARERIDSFDELKRGLLRNGAAMALLAGSGSSLFAVFESLELLILAERELRKAGLQTHRATTLKSWPEPLSRD
jgi:4-diphosphocytidyl-2-C-methyl-D-erythritol kinase